MPIKQRVILDTNIYGIVVEENKTDFTRRLSASDVVVYGSDVIRRELRATPKTRSFHENIRQKLLNLYDEIVLEHTLRINIRTASIATEYALFYQGGISKERLSNDFLIVACASVHNLAIVVTADNHSMNSSWQSNPTKR